LAVASALASLSFEALAANCVLPPRNDLVATGDRHYQVRMGCSQGLINGFVDDFAMDEVDWNEGMGWSTACDPHVPLARTFHGLMALKYSDPNPITNGAYGNEVLRWAGLYSINEFDELDSGCAFHASASALTYNDPPIDEKTILYMDFFYTYAPSERAAVLLHEARHASGNDHAPNNCPRGASCDTAYNGAGGAVKGANTYQVWYASTYADRAWRANWINKDRARDHANHVLDTGFNNPTTARNTVSKDTPLAADLNNDGFSDLVVFRESDGSWQALDGLGLKTGVRTELLQPSIKYGMRTDQPFIGDIDRDGHKDLIIYRTALSTDPWAQVFGRWFAYSFAKGKQLFGNIELGVRRYPAWQSTIPLVGDIDGDGGADIVQYDPANGFWFAFKGTSLTVPAAPVVPLWGLPYGGLPGDVPLLGNFNNDANDELVIFRPSNGTWHVFSPFTNTQLMSGVTFGENGDIPLVGDFDGLGRTNDLVIYRPWTGEWFARMTESATFFGPKQFGALADRPLLGRFQSGSTRVDPIVYRGLEASWGAVDRMTNALLLCADGLPTCASPGIQYGIAY
jgi:hypothetical protein